MIQVSHFFTHFLSLFVPICEQITHNVAQVCTHSKEHSSSYMSESTKWIAYAWPMAVQKRYYDDDDDGNSGHNRT